MVLMGMSRWVGPWSIQKIKKNKDKGKCRKVSKEVKDRVPLSHFLTTQTPTASGVVALYIYIYIPSLNVKEIQTKLPLHLICRLIMTFISQSRFSQHSHLFLSLFSFSLSVCYI